MKIKKRLNELKEPTMTTKEWVDYVEEVSSALGSFIVTFNSLDLCITEGIIDLANYRESENDDMCYLLIAEKTFSQRLYDLGIMLKYRLLLNPNKKELEKEIDEVIKSAHNINKTRNTFIHADWYETEKESEQILVLSKTKLDRNGFYHEYFKCSVESIEEAEIKCDDLSDKLENLVKKINCA